MIIRHAAMEDLKAVTELEAKCFPAAEAAGRAAFFDRLASFPDHFCISPLTIQFSSFIIETLCLNSNNLNSNLSFREGAVKICHIPFII